MIKIAHFSDLHYGSKTLTEADNCFSSAVDTAIGRGVDCAVISGDATDHALDVHAPAVAALAKNVRRLADHCPVVMLQGTYSHEPPGTLDIFRLLGGRYPVHVADRIGQVALSGGQWHASSGWSFVTLPTGCDALLTVVPTVNKAAVAAVCGAAGAGEALGNHLAQLLAGFGAINALARRAGIPTVGISHGTVNGCLTEHGVPMAGLDHEFTAGALFSAGTSAFLLGHIHKHQSWQDGERRIAYAGSIGRFHFGEQGAKGFLEWEVDAEGACLRLIETPARRNVEIAFDGLPDMAELAEIARQPGIQGAHLRLRWNVPEEARHQVDRKALAALFAGAAEVKLEGRVIPVVRARAAGISRQGTLAMKIESWAQTTAVTPAPLIECLARLQIHDPERIAAEVLGSTEDDTAPPTAAAASPDGRSQQTLPLGDDQALVPV